MPPGTYAPTAAAAEEDPSAPAYDARLVRRLLTYVRPHRQLMAPALGCMLVTAGMQLAGPMLTRWVIDAALPARDMTLVMRAAFAFAGLLVVQFASAYGETVLTARIGQQVMRDLRLEIFTRLQQLPIGYYDRTPVGRLVTRVTSDVEALNELFTAGVVAGVGDLFTLVAIGVVMLVIDWKLALAAFAVMPLVLLVSRVFQQRVRSSYRVIRTRIAQINAYLGERLTGIRLVQLFGREADELSQFETLNRGHLDAQLKSITWYALYFPTIELLTTLALASLLVTSGFLVKQEALTVGTVAAFLQLVRRFFQPLQDLSEKYNILQAAMAASERIFALLDTPPAPGLTPPSDLAARVAHTRQRGVTIAFEDVWFAYPREGGISDDHAGATPVPSLDGQSAAEEETQWVLKGVSFVVPAGHALALVGHTGAGKSTIASLLLRFYEPQRGRILLNGEDIRDLPLDLLRSVIGYVQQDIFLFAGDIAANLRLGSALDDAALHRAAGRVGADRVIARLPGGWRQELGERGVGISVGERQLLAFARAIASDPSLLILDEATSAVDSAIEADIRRAVGTLMQGRTTVAIAHRLSSVVEADEILVLHHGVVVERGTHRTLVAAGGMYERLFRLQAGAPGLVERLPSAAASG